VIGYSRDSLFWHDFWMAGVVLKNHLRRLYSRQSERKKNVRLIDMVLNDVEGVIYGGGGCIIYDGKFSIGRAYLWVDIRSQN
jgi:hypothetical protein